MNYNETRHHVWHHITKVIEDDDYYSFENSHFYAHMTKYSSLRTLILKMFL